MIRLESVRKTYSDFDVDLDFSVEKGELVSLLGPSGSGKTTTLRIIAGFERPDSGRILLNGSDVTDLDPADRRIGFVFQDYTLFPHLDAAGNIAFGLKGRPRAEIEERVGKFLALTGLAGYGRRRVHTLSGGEQQRVALARALAAEPLVLMLDEPFSSIDGVLRRELKEEILRLQREVGVTTIFITHDREEALSISDRIVLLREGRIAQSGAPRELYERPRNSFVASFTGQANFITGEFRGLKGGFASVGAAAGYLASDPWGKLEGAPDGEGKPRMVRFMVRADRIGFVAEQGINTVSATITAKRYYGHYWEYFCSSGEGDFVVTSRDGDREPGPVLLSFAPEDAVIVEI